MSTNGDSTPAPSVPTLVSEPGWARYAIAWHVFPLGAVGAPALCPEGDPLDPSSPAGAMAAEHRLRRLIGWLDHLVGLGCNVLLLGPVFHSMSHGYDTVDYRRVDPRLGTNEDLTDLIAAAHAKGIKVVLDGVFNHTGIGCPAFAGLAQSGPRSPEAGMYHLTWADDGEGWQSGQAPVDYHRFEGQDWLPELNHDSPEVATLVTEVMTTWCERGVDGWRLDAAYAVAPEFWTRVLPRVRERFPEVYVVGEVIHGDYAAIVRGSGMSAVTQYELWQSTWHALAEANFYELDWNLRRGLELLGTFVPFTFLDNHDTSRIASLVGDPQRAGHALALLMVLPGLPSVYYGDEEGWQAVKEERLGGDDAIRPELPPSPAKLSTQGEATRHLYQELIALRRRLPWLHDAVYETVHLDNTVMSLAVRRREGSSWDLPEGTPQEVVVALSLEPTEVWLPTLARHEVLSCTHGAPRPRPERDGVVLPPTGWAVLG